MDRVINIKVGGNHLSKDNKNAGVRGEANVTRLRITFDEGWDEYAKTVTFWDAIGKNPVKRILTTDYLENIVENTRVYLIPIPAEPLAIAGELTFVIDGYIDGKRQRSFSDKLVVKEAPMTDSASEPVDPIPTQAEQLQGQIDGIINTIQDATIAKDAAETAQDAAETARDRAGTSAAIAEEMADRAESLSVAAQGSSSEAEAYAQKAEVAAGSFPYIGDNGNWYAWNSTEGSFYDTGVKAQSGSTVYLGDNPPADADVWIDLDGEEDTTQDIDAHMSNTDIHTTAEEKADVNERIHTAQLTAEDAKDEAQNVYSLLLLVEDEIVKKLDTKADKPKLSISGTTALIYDFAERDNNVAREGELESVSFVFTNDAYDELFISELTFDSGDTPTVVDFPYEDNKVIINWYGTDCAIQEWTDDEGNHNIAPIFQPSANTRYNIMFWFDGADLVGKVHGYVPANRNVVS